MIRLTKIKSKYPDELVKEIINCRLNGDSLVLLASIYEISEKNISNWVNGTNRGHLLDEVLDQRHKEGKL